jgi:hypothetical protein
MCKYLCNAIVSMDYEIARLRLNSQDNSFLDSCLHDMKDALWFSINLISGRRIYIYKKIIIIQ